MNIDEINTGYRSHSELNENTPSTGTITCYDGTIVDCETKKPWLSQFIEIADCHTKCRLHRGSYDSPQDWTKKVDILCKEIEKYREYLHKKYDINNEDFLNNRRGSHIFNH